jgi:uroporphyrinogen-III synthase
MLVFFSPSGIRSLFHNFPKFKQNTTVIATFGETTCFEAKSAGLKVAVEAPNPQAPSMTMAIDQFLQKHNKGK